MSLKTLFALPIAVVLLVALSLAAMDAGEGWSAQQQGKAAVEAVERMRLLQVLQNNLREERVVSNFVFGKSWPPTDALKQRLAVVRNDTDLGIAGIGARLTANEVRDPDGTPQPQYLPLVRTRLAAARLWIDELLVSGPPARTYTHLNELMPRLLAVSELLNAPLVSASLAVTAADPALSGLLVEDRLTVSLRDHVGLIAAILLPRYSAGIRPGPTELERVRVLLARAAYVTGLLRDTAATAGATEPVRDAIDRLATFDPMNLALKLADLTDTVATGEADIGPLLPQTLWVPWGEHIDALRTAIVRATVAEVTASRDVRERQFDIVLTGFGLVMIAMLESMVLLSQRVVRPIAHLGQAITRIAAGDRRLALVMNSGTREIAEMVTAVETLRRAALVADAATMRQRLATRHRLSELRKALGMAQAVREPARALERGVASLSEGIDAAIVLTTTSTSSPPPSLGLAAAAVRTGLAEIRDAAADLEATFTAASYAQQDDRPEAELVACILAVKAQVDRRDATVRGFVQSGLVGLRDVASAGGGLTDGLMLRDLVSDQFQRIEATVAAVASMRDATARAADIVRDLPFEDEPLAA